MIRVKRRRLRGREVHSLRYILSRNLASSRAIQRDLTLIPLDLMRFRGLLLHKSGVRITLRHDIVVNSF